MNACFRSAISVNTASVSLYVDLASSRAFALTSLRNQDRALVVDNVRVRAVGRSSAARRHVTPIHTPAPGSHDATVVGKQTAAVLSAAPQYSVFFEGGRVPAPFARLRDLPAFAAVSGPAVIVDDTFTIVVEPGCTAHVTQAGDVRLEVSGGSQRRVGVELDSVQLSIFSHRFMSIAEQMV
jgi:5-oxoprolinase (ATP-hydrolysing)